MHFWIKNMRLHSTASKILAAMLAAAIAAPLAAQDTDTSIVVEAERERNRDARSQARAITPRDPAVTAPIARFQDPVCPGVWGLDEESARFIIDRIMYNAQRIGLDVPEEEGCAANVIIAFVPDPHAEFAAMREESHPLVSGIDLWERKRVADQTGPVLAWNTIATLTSDGQSRSGGGQPTFESTQIGRTGLATRRDIVSSVVFIQRDAIADKDGVAVADYATMRALVKTRPPEEGTSFGTVLSLFDENNATSPDRLSQFDLAYLTSIYASRANSPSRMALGNVGALMEEVEAD